MQGKVFRTFEMISIQRLKEASCIIFSTRSVVTLNHVWTLRRPFCYAEKMNQSQYGLFLVAGLGLNQFAKEWQDFQCGRKMVPMCGRRKAYNSAET